MGDIAILSEFHSAMRILKYVRIETMGTKIKIGRVGEDRFRFLSVIISLGAVMSADR
jgi:hypothetical protein